MRWDVDFDDFPEEPDRESAPRAGDRFFAEWEGGRQDAVAPAAVAPVRPRRGKTVGVVAALCVLVAVPMLAGRQSPPPEESTAGFRVPAMRTIMFELDPPVDRGSTVTLTWRSDGDLEYAVVVAGAALPTKVLLVERQHTLQVPVDPGRQYCFLIQGTDGVQVYETAPQPVRHATCRRRASLRACHQILILPADRRRRANRE